LKVSRQLGRSGRILTFCGPLDAALEIGFETAIFKCGDCTLQGGLSGHGDL